MQSGWVIVGRQHGGKEERVICTVGNHPDRIMKALRKMPLGTTGEAKFIKAYDWVRAIEQPNAATATSSG